MTETNDFDRLNLLLKTDDERQKNVAACMAEVQKLGETLSQSLGTHPQAVAEFLGEYRDMPTSVLQEDIKREITHRNTKCQDR